MGFFDSEKVFVDVLATKLTDNEVTPLKNAVISSAVRDSGISDGVLAGMLNGLGARAHRFYKYAEAGKWSGEKPIVDVGLITELGEPYDTTPYPGTFYPVPVLRENKVFLTPESNEVLHKETKRLLKRIALNVDDLVDNIQDTTREDENGAPIEGNPSENLDDVFFMFGLDLYSQEEESAVYMYDFWEHTAPEVKQDVNGFQEAVNAFITGSEYGAPPPIPSNVIAFHNTGQHTLYYVFDYMFQDTTPGTLLDEEGKKIDAKAEIVKGQITTYENTPENVTFTYYVDSSYVQYSKQISEGVIGTITVYGLHHETLVDAYGDLHRVVRTINDLSDPDAVDPNPPIDPNPQITTEGPTVQVGYSTGTYETYNGLVPGDVDFGRSAFYMPLCFEVLELQHPIQEEKILSDAMIIIMHAAQEVDLKWYQQGWFKIVMWIIMAVIIYFSVGTGTEIAVSLVDTLTELAIQFGLAFIVNLIAKEIGGELGLILGIAVAAYAAYRGDFTKADALMSGAKEILVATHAITSAVNAKIKVDITELKSEIEDFDQSVEERKDYIHEIASMLGDPTAEINLLDLIYENSNNYIPGSSPDEWLQRVKGMKNAAPIVKENISLYHSRMKDLPNALRDNNFAVT